MPEADRAKPAGVPCNIAAPAGRMVPEVYHYRGERYFGCTQQGKFICEREAQHEGDRATRNGQ
jgi:hypothetical protein